MTTQELMAKFEAELSKAYDGNLSIRHEQAEDVISDKTYERVIINDCAAFTWEHQKENKIMDCVQSIADLLKANESK